MSEETTPNNRSTYKGGYERLAQGMRASDSMAIFRRFATLSIENLLYLQADLVRLERDLRRSQEEDRTSKHNFRSRYSMDWELIYHSRKEAFGASPQQLETILEIRSRLKEYRKAPYF